MRELSELRKRIEEARSELNRSFGRDSYEVYYPKSRKLDRLIEEYMDRSMEKKTVG